MLHLSIVLNMYACMLGQETWHKLHVIITSVTTHPHCPSMIGLISLVQMFTRARFIFHKYFADAFSPAASLHLPLAPITDSVYQRLSSMLYNFGNRARQQAEQQAQAAQEAQQ